MQDDEVRVMTYAEFAAARGVTILSARRTVQRYKWRKTKGNDGLPRPLRPRSFATLSQAEEENGQSRIYLGIHWAFDKTAGIAQGRRVADYVFDNLLRPIRA